MKKWLIGASLVGSLMAGCGPVYAAAAATNGVNGAAEAPSHVYPVSADVGSAGMGGAHQFDVKSSVQVSRETLRDAYQASHDAYTKKLQRYAKCSESDAKKAVLAEHPGTKIEELQLRNIRTSLVYMAIARDDEDKYLVIVDAGNGNILMDRRVPTHHEQVFADKGPDGHQEE